MYCYCLQNVLRLFFMVGVKEYWRAEDSMFTGCCLIPDSIIYFDIFDLNNIILKYNKMFHVKQFCKKRKMRKL